METADAGRAVRQNFVEQAAQFRVRTALVVEKELSQSMRSGEVSHMA